MSEAGWHCSPLCVRVPWPACAFAPLCSKLADRRRASQINTQTRNARLHRPPAWGKTTIGTGTRQATQSTLRSDRLHQTTARAWSEQGTSSWSYRRPLPTYSTTHHTMDHEGGDRGEAGTASPQSRAQQEWQNEELDTLDLRESPPHPSTSAAAAASSSSHPIVAHDDIQDFPPDFFDRPISFETAWRELREAEARIRPPPGDEEPKTLPGPLAGRGPQQQPRPASGSWQDTDSEDDDEEAEDEVYAGAQQMRRASTNGHLSDSESTTAENVCRICRCGPEPGQPLYHPCKCAGSIRYCHQDW